jgi:RNA polymerase sigma factor (TIGR02999 family)
MGDGCHREEGIPIATRREARILTMKDVTRILNAIEQGDPQAAEQLIPLVYDELRAIAARRLAREKPGQTIQATALVHEAYLRLIDDEARRWDSRAHFFAAAAEAMRRILVENARAKHRLKRGGSRGRRDLDPDSLAAPEVSEDILAIDEALDRLAAVDRRAAEVVRLRVFAGMTVKEAAGVLGVSPRTVDHAWAYARAWLLAALRDPDD